MPFCTLYLTVADEKGEKSNVNFPCNLPTLDDIEPALNALADLVDPLITGGIVSAGVSLAVDLTTVQTIADALSDVQEGARFVFRSVGNFIKSVRLPTFDESLIVGGTSVVDLDDLDVFAFVTAITDGIDLSSVGGTGLVTFQTIHAEDLTDLDKATEDWGRNRG